MSKMQLAEVEKYIDDMPDEVLRQISFSMPWQYDTEDKAYKDPDGFRQERDNYTVKKLQDECWNKFHKNPQINTAVRGRMGRLTGLGFETTSEVFKIQKVIDEVEQDPRNRLYNFWPKYVGRSDIEGELFLNVSLHLNGFTEIDFIDPSTIGGDGDDDSGIIFHPSKPQMPLFYRISLSRSEKIQVPSIFVARYPELVTLVRDHKDFNRKEQKKCRSRRKVYRQFGGYTRFIIAWDKGFITTRAVSYLRTILEWINHYELLKKYEIDHKKSSGAYLWKIKIEDSKAFREWLKLSDEDRRKTGIMQKKTPGGTLLLPPGFDMQCENPSLTAIREQDTDILQMVGSGLNEPDDVMTGQSKGTFASVKASRGPMSDRISDEVAYFERFLVHDFWGSIFFLRSAVDPDFPPLFKNRECVGFTHGKEGGTPKFDEVKRRPEELIEVAFPTSEVIDMEARSRAGLGVKHGPLAEALGIPNKEVAKRLGFGGYGRLRQGKAEEDERYTKLEYNVDAEAVQEQQIEKPKPNKPPGSNKK